MAVLSIILFFASLLFIGLVVWRLPADYFLTGKHTHWLDPVRYPNLYMIWRLVRNIMGFALIILGVIMLVLPGQGVLTIVIGLMLVDFPAKRHFLHKLTAMKSVRKSLNYLRKKMGKAPFVFP